MVDQNSLVMEHKPTWCPGCGNFGILQALKQAFVKLNLTPEKAVAVFDIGCNSNMFNWLPMTSFESLHGRPLPVAQGVKIARPDLTVFAISGDGGCYGEGGNDFLHAVKRNIDMTLLVHDNQIYALTAGQTSPTTAQGLKTKSTPNGSLDPELNPLTVALSAGATFVARGFAGDLPQLTELITAAVNHKGFSVLDILQPCVTFNYLNTFDWFRQRVYHLDSEGYKPDNRLKAIEKAMEFPLNGNDSKIPTGIFYQEPARIVTQSVVGGEHKTNIDELIKEFV